MWESWLLVIVAIFIALILIFVVVKFLKKKSKLGNIYTPFDDVMRGTGDANHLREEMTDTRQLAPMEQVEEKEERTIL